MRSPFRNFGDMGAADDFLTNPNNPTRRLFQQMEHREREQNARAGHGDFLSDPNHPTRRLFRQMEQREREHNARAGHGDFLSDPNHPIRRLFRQMEQSDPHDDFLTNHSHFIRRRLAATHRQVPRHGAPAADSSHFHQGHGHVKLPPACTFTPRAVPERTECAICLEALQAGQSSRRPPCLHVFHDLCLSMWNRRSSKCPLCNLDLAASPTILRYRLQDIASLKAAELRYLAAYLGVDVQGAVERTFLESAILASRHIHLLSSHQELLSLSAGKLKRLITSFSAKNSIGLVEKPELAQAIMASSRFEEEHIESATACTAWDGTSTVNSMASDLETALNASVQEADARAATVNGPLSSAILRSRLVPDVVVLLEVDRTLSTLRDALLIGDELATVRDALENHDHPVELPSGAKVFVRPEQYISVMTAVEGMELKPRHILVSQELHSLVNRVIGAVKRTTVKRRRVTTTRPSFCNWRSVQVNVEIKRTFIHLEIPSSLPSGPSSKHAASA